ncbi:MAG TPA: hypothetical protein VNT75_20620 [Symbiobacteriaceae bacterium]|nr:hypothetical protein [Symbiobacteriaceae bacterium]
MPNTLALILFGLLSATVSYAGITGTKLPLITSPRAALIALLVVGMAMCGPGMRVGTYKWTHPTMIAGSLIGAVMLIVALAGIFGLKLPYVTGPRDALIILTGGMIIKILIDVARTMLA